MRGKKTTILTICQFAALCLQAQTVDTLRLTQLQEVEIVTTVKEQGDVRQQPIGVTQMGSKEMAAHQVTSLKGSTGIVPNLFIPDYGSRLTSAIYIRGIGSRINQPAVGLYVDGIPYVDKSAFDFNFYNIERIDVLRGPQGTLYGSNTMGGLVRVYTRNPFRYRGTDIHLGYATGNQHRTISLTHYHRVSDKFAFSAGGYYEGASGFFKNDLTGKCVDGMQAGGGRIRAVYRPNEPLSFDFTLGYDYTDEGAYPYYYTGSRTETELYPDLIGKITNNRENSYRRGMLNGGLNIGYRTDRWEMNAVTGYQFLSDRMFMDQDFLTPDIYTLEQKQRIHTLTEEVTFKNRRQSKWDWLCGVNLMYQDLHTEGPVTFYRDGLDWLASTVNSVMPKTSDIEALDMMGFKDMALNFRGEALHMDGTYKTPTASVAVFHHSTYHFTDHWSATLGFRLDYTHQEMTYHSPADVYYGFTMPNDNNPRMSVNLQQLQSHISFDGTLKHDRFYALPKVALQYAWGEKSGRDVCKGTIYTSFAMGQRSGGYNLQMFSDLLQGEMRSDMMTGVREGVGDYIESLYSDPANASMPQKVPDKDENGNLIFTPLPQFVRNVMAKNMPQAVHPDIEQVVYKPERSWNYELGMHVSEPASHLEIDAAVFYSRIFNQQIARFAPSGLGRMMVNAGESRSCGGELAIRWTPDKHWLLSASYGYTNAKFKEYDDGNGNDYAGNYVPFVPLHTMNVDAAHTWFFDNDLRLTFGVGATGVGRLYWTESNNASQAFYALLGSRLSFDYKNYTLTLWGKNMSDTRYNTFFFESASRGYEQHGKPLQFGVDVKVHF